LTDELLFEKDTVKRTVGIAAFAALVGAIAVWNASPAGAEDVVAQASPAPAASPAPSPSPSPTPVPKAFSISGFGDVGYTSASQASNAGTSSGPASDPQGRLITGRVFDNVDNSVMFHNFNVQVAYAPQLGFGGKVEYSFGQDADVIHSYPQSLQYPGNDVDLTQAYGSYTGGPITVIVGKFETLAGAEVIESPNDLNFSRSILFGYAVPFTHTGGRITYAVNGNLSLIAGANQGWDTTKTLPSSYTTAAGINPDVNALTAEYGLAWNPSKAVGLTVQGYNGPVPQGTANVGAGQPIRTLTDFVATWHYTSALTFILNGDIASQSRTLVLNNAGGCVLNSSGLCTVGNVSWDGAALYASYVRGLWTFTGRGEYFADNGGSRTGAQRDWEEGTATAQWAPNNNLMFRAEYRYDTSSNQFFVNTTTTPSFNNSGFGLEAIVKWP
jgi:hypothetical protein